ncbi:MAG: hypothetical protein ACNA8W_10780 [Bradymonadaceae bacterium]
MSKRPLPEAIRGCWYYVSHKFDLDERPLRPRQILCFRVDGSFSRYQLKEQSRKELEKGDYTFDGHFLILRGRNTDTFRVRSDDFWKWTLEGKKDDHFLMRGLVTESAFQPLSTEDQKEIRILPLRVNVRSDFEGPDLIYDLVYQPSEKEPTAVGSFFVEHHADGRLWIGVTPYVEGITTKTWERIIQDSYLDFYLGKPDDIRVVTVRLLDTSEAQVFNYQTS